MYLGRCARHPDSPAWAGDAAERMAARAKIGAREHRIEIFIYRSFGQKMRAFERGVRSSSRRKLILIFSSDARI